MVDVCIIYIATGPYIRYWNEFHQTAEKYLFTEKTRRYILATDAYANPALVSYKDTSVFHLEHKPWPLPTLKRYHTFLDLKPYIDSLEPLYIFFFNANTRFCRKITWSELVPSSHQGLVGVEHPGYKGLHPLLCPHERRKYINCALPWKHRKPYMQGCLLGGHSDNFWDMANVLSCLVDQALQEDHIAVWHDESYWNWYCKDLNIKIMPAEYAFPLPRTCEVPHNAKIVMEIKTGIRNITKKSSWPKKAVKILRSLLSQILWGLDSVII